MWFPFGKKVFKTLDKVVSLRWLMAVPSVLFGERAKKIGPYQEHTCVGESDEESNANSTEFSNAFGNTWGHVYIYLPSTDFLRYFSTFRRVGSQMGICCI